MQGGASQSILNGKHCGSCLLPTLKKGFWDGGLSPKTLQKWAITNTWENDIVFVCLNSKFTLHYDETYMHIQSTCLQIWMNTDYAFSTSFVANPLSVCPLSDMIWVYSFRDKDPRTWFPSGGHVLLVCQIFPYTCPGRAAVSQSAIGVILEPDMPGLSASSTRTVCPGLCSLSGELHYLGIFPSLLLQNQLTYDQYVLWIGYFSLALTVWYLSEVTWRWDDNPFYFYKLASFH